MSLSTVRRLAVVAILILALLFYLHNINRWFMEDDEGAYLYAAWRISEGEMPYWDFLTPQLPLFLYLGAGLMKLFGGSTFAIRSASAILVLSTALFVYLTAKRAFGYGVALLSMLLFLAHPDIYWAARFYRPEAYMLLFAAMGTYIFVVSYLAGWDPGFLAAGALFALATLCKFFGFMPLAGCSLFMLYDLIRCKAKQRQALKSILGLTIAYVVVVGTVVPAFYRLTPNFFEAVLGHHLMQGSELTRLQVFIKGLRFYLSYLRKHTLFLILAALGIVKAFRAKREPQVFFALQIPTALVFLLLSRELFFRHLVYLVPSLCVLCASSLEPLLTWRSKAAITLGNSNIRTHFFDTVTRSLSDVKVRALLLLLALAGLLIPWVQKDLEVSAWSESDTWRLAEYIAANTREDDYVLTDYPRLNFYARRKTTYSGAGLSGGATQSGQITGRQLIKEIEENQVKMILIQTKGGWPHPHQLVKLRDYGDLRQYVSARFHLVRGFYRNGQMYDVYHAEDLAPITPLNVNFDDKLALTGYGFESATVEAGGELPIVLYWESQQRMKEDYDLFLHMVDERRHLWGQEDIEIQNALTLLTSRWDVGDVNEEGYVLPVWAGTPPGEYQVEVGLFQINTGERLNILDENGVPVGTAYTLASVQVMSPVKLPLVDDLPIQHPLRQGFADRIELLGYAINTESARPGDRAGLTMFWRGLRAMDVDYRILLQLQGEDAQIWAQNEEDVSLYPTSQWRSGEVIRAQYDLAVDATAPAGDYRLLVNLLDGDTGQRLLESYLPLEKIRVVAPERQFAVPKNIQHPMRANLANRVTFLGYDLDRTTVKPDEMLHLTLYWQAQKQMETSYKVFTHLLDAQNRIWGQRDSIPVGGMRPTTGWLQGEVIVDGYEIAVKLDAPGGTYQIEVGMYDATTMERVLTSEGSDHLILPSEIVIKP